MKRHRLLSGKPASVNKKYAEQGRMAVPYPYSAYIYACLYPSGWGSLFHRNRLGQIPWLVHITSTHHGNVIGQQLQRNHR